MSLTTPPAPIIRRLFSIVYESLLVTAVSLVARVRSEACASARLGFGRQGAHLGRGVAEQLSPELEPTLVALRQQLQRATLDRKPGARAAHANPRQPVSP